MIKQKYISTLLQLSLAQILKGIEEINLKYRENIIFNDKLNCICLKNWKLLKNSFNYIFFE